MNNNVSKQVLLSVIGVAILVIAVIGVSFALYIELRPSEGHSPYYKVEYNNDIKEISLTNSLPVSMEQGKNSSNVISFSIEGHSIQYEIKVLSGEKEPNKTRLKDNEVFAYISSEDVEGVKFTPSGNFGTTGQALNSNETIIGTGNFAPLKESGKADTEEKVAAYKRNFDIHFWVDESAVSVSEDGTYTPSDYQNTYYSVRVIVDQARVK